MNMGPVHDRSRSSREPEQNKNEGYRAAAHDLSSNPDELSGDPRRRLASLADRALREQPDSDTSPELRETKLNKVRDKIASGFYGRPETKKAIAEKLFDSLDL